MIWAALAGLGSASLLLSSGTAVLFLLWSADFLRFPSAPGFTAAYLPALLVGVVVARAAGGWAATLGVVALGVAAATRLLAYTDAETLFSYSAIPVGLLLGVVAAAVVGRRHIPFQHPLEAAGVFGLVGFAGFLIDTAARLYAPAVPYAFGLALSLVGTVGAGVLLARRSPRPMHDAILLAGVLVAIALVWLPTVWLGGGPTAWDPPDLVAARAWRLAQPLVLIGAAWLATLIGATLNRRNDPTLRRV